MKAALGPWLSLAGLTVLCLQPESTFAQTFSVLHTFASTGSLTNSDGIYPAGDLVLAGGTLFGTAHDGGSNGYGTVFSVDTTGSNFAVLYTFTGSSDGALPLRHLVLSGSFLYGTTGRGTNGGFGTIFSIETNGSNFATVYTFTGGSDGQNPGPGLAIASDTLYGTAYQGGDGGDGTVFSVGTNGNNFTVLHTFGGSPDGKNPNGGVVVSGGLLYSTARNGGLNSGAGWGTLFSVELDDSQFTLLHTFAGHTNADGEEPQGGLFLSSNVLYGTTFAGGSNGYGTVYAFDTTASGYNILRTFSPGAGGAYFEGGTVLAGNTLYGVTIRDGLSSYSGTLFSLNTDGSSFTLLHSFSPADPDVGYTNWDGCMPYGDLVLSGNVLYGTVLMGGRNGVGTVFAQAIVPVITNLSLVGTSAVLNGINAMGSHTYTVLASTNLTLPPNLWNPIATNVLNSGGNFSMTATNAASGASGGQFYILQAQ